MSLKATLSKAVNSAFTAIGDVAESCTYRRTVSTYSPSTGANVVANTDATITKALFTKYSNLEVDRVSVMATDVKLIIQVSAITVTPNLSTDKIVRTSESSKVYNIINVSKDPAGTIFILQLRSPS